MMRFGFGLASLLALGCGMRMQDPCAGVSATCVAVQVDPSPSVSSARALSLQLTLDGVARPATVLGDGLEVALPVGIGIVFDSPAASSQLRLAVTGERQGLLYRSDTIARTLVAGQHMVVRVQLAANPEGDAGVGEPDLASADLPMFDATIGDLATTDLTVGPAPTPPDMTAPLPARLLWPMSTATVTSQRPRLAWEAPSGGSVTDVVVDLCADRGCNGSALQSVTIDAGGTSGVPVGNLAAGLVFWRVRANVSGVATVSTVWQFYVGRISALNSTAYGTTLDYNGDGYADVVIGAWNAAQGDGRAYAFPGGRRATIGTVGATLSSGVHDGGAFGGSVASAGDVDGDGYADIIVGAASALGRAYVFWGGRDGLDAAHPAMLYNGINSYESFGVSVAGVGDIDGDGYGDVIVGAQNAGGKAYVFWGGARNTYGQARTPILGEGGGFGAVVASAGDVDGDGRPDIIIGAAGAGSGGKAYIYWGGGTRDAFAAGVPTPLESGVADNDFGNDASCAGDIDGDGFTDVIVGSTQVHAAYVFFGGTSRDGLLATMATIAVDVTGFGSSVAGLGDVGARGYSVVGIGAADSNSGAGSMYIDETPGFVRGRSFENPYILTNGTDAGLYGAAMAAAGDVDGDGYGDILVGAKAVGMNVGKAYILFGGDSQSPSSIISLTNGVDGGYFGSSVAHLMRRASPNRNLTALLCRPAGPKERSHRAQRRHSFKEAASGPSRQPEPS
jgi:hypothetical protein